MYRCSKSVLVVTIRSQGSRARLGLPARRLSSRAVVQIRKVGESGCASREEESTHLANTVIEHVDGRARHLSWSTTGKLEKKWKEITAANNCQVDEIEGSTGSSALGRVGAWLRQMFLPTNYPQSVHKSYLPFHILQFFECTLGTLVSVLCNQALLVSVGVSAEGSIFGAVVVQWIIKDGAGELAKLFFIRRFSPYFDSHPKTFNLFGEGIVLLGSGLQIASLIGPPTATHFLMCAAGGNIFKLIGHAIWWTTHIKFVRYFALHGNTGDVAAKTESHASVAQLLGYASGIGLLSFSHTASYLYSIFAVAVPAHLILTTWMLRVASFELLTIPRASWLANSYVSSARDAMRGGVVSLEDMEKSHTTGLFGEFYKTKEEKFITVSPRVEGVLSSDDSNVRERWNACVSLFNGEKYLLYPSQFGSSKSPLISIFLHPSVTIDDMLRAILHAAHLRHLLVSYPSKTSAPTIPSTPSPSTPALDASSIDILAVALEKSKRWTARHFDQFKAEVERTGWRTDEIAFADHGRRVLWGEAAQGGS